MIHSIFHNLPLRLDPLAIFFPLCDINIHNRLRSTDWRVRGSQLYLISRLKPGRLDWESVQQPSGPPGPENDLTLCPVYV